VGRTKATDDPPSSVAGNGIENTGEKRNPRDGEDKWNTHEKHTRPEQRRLPRHKSSSGGAAAAFSRGSQSYRFSVDSEAILKSILNQF
jgi:hypothetical protein